jgi:hypothetical protein
VDPQAPLCPLALPILILPKNVTIAITNECAAEILSNYQGVKAGRAIAFTMEECMTK